jgi:hypothetical protein
LEIGPHHSALGQSSQVMATISASSSWPQPVGPAEVPGSASEADATLPLPSGVPGVGVRLSLPSEIPGTGVEPSSSSRMDSLNRSYVNTPGEGGPRLDPS